MSSSNWIHLEVVEVKAKTEKAMLVELEDGEEIWIPLSQIADSDDYDKGDENCTISVTEWIAEQKDLL